VALNDPVVNQSYTFGALFVADQQQVDRRFDDYAARFKTLFVSAVDNGGGVHAPSTCYNGIGVGAYNGLSSIGPTADNGRCKPDICAPDYVTSFATPQVSGAAVLLLQAALRGDGGKVKQLAADPRTLKALLLNGAIKPPDWTNSSSAPLDARYGAGRVNVYNSYQQLIGGKRNYSVSSRVASGGAHPPMAGNKTVSVLSGWDYNNVTSSRSLAARDGVNHYYFNATNTPTGVTCQATLVWNRHFGKTNINNLDLFLYDCANSNLVACSTSLVDNVEHIFAPNLPPGRYDLQVWKAGDPDAVSAEETYVLAFAFISPQLTVSSSESSLALQWPAYPDGLQIETSTDISAPESWNTDTLPDPTYTNGQHVIWLNATNTAQFFRLRQP
jgi:hypothetical protein